MLTRLPQERLEQEHYHRQEQQQLLSQARRQTKQAGRALLHELSSGGGNGSDVSSSSGGGDGNGDSGGSEGCRRSWAWPSRQAAGLPEGKAAWIGGQKRQQEGKRRQRRQHEWPALGQRWDDATGSTWPAGQQAANAEAAGNQQEQAQQQADAAGRPRGRRFMPPPLSIITGVGRHSKGGRGGVLKAAVRQTLQQQGLPALDDPSNEGGGEGALSFR